MPLEPGTTLGPYQVTAKIGEGGMGEVYRARDTKLDRDVALKVLPQAFTDDPDRLARFEREAKVLASLNHPNIGHIYGLEEAEGQKALVLELVKGPTLADRIKQGPIPVDEALPIAKQIAEALEAAHEQGVIHRDLKPANIKVRADGMVKVLDFGLAKAFQPDASDVSASMSPTISLTAAATQMGMVIGTAAYMAPEQAKGKTVDKRADVWALGAVLYEMLSGKKPFVGDDVSDTLALVLKFEPQWDALPDDTPARIRQLVQTCLHKDPKRRVHDVADVRLAMEGVFETMVGASPDGTVAPPLEVWQRPVPLFFAGIVLAAISGLAVWTLTRPGLPAPRPPARFTLSVPATDQFLTGFALSPDGQELVYTAVRDGVQQLFHRSMGDLEAVPIRGTDGANGPFFSPDSASVGFFAGGALRKVLLGGGTPVTLCSTDRRRGASWGEDDTILFASDAASGVMRVSAAGGTPQPVTTTNVDERENSHRWLDALPDGKGVLFTIWSGQVGTARIAVQSLEAAGEPQVLVDGTDPRYVPSGHIVFAREDSLWAVPFDLERLTMTGEPNPVVEGVQVNTGGWAQFAVADDGTLLYAPVRGGGGAQTLVWLDRDGRQEELLGTGGYHSVDISPDGGRIALELADEDGRSDVWTYDVARGTLNRLTSDPAEDRTPLWTPDGERIVFGSQRDGPWGLFWRAADGTGDVESILTYEDTVALAPKAWSPDGTKLLFHRRIRGQNDIGVLSMEGDRSAELLFQEEVHEERPSVSPDGEWVAYSSNRTGSREVYVERYPDLGDRQVISTDGGTHPLWSSDGRELFYLANDSTRVMVVPVDMETGLNAGAPRVMFEVEVFTFGERRPYDIAPDDERFVVIKDGGAAYDDNPPAGSAPTARWKRTARQPGRPSFLLDGYGVGRRPGTTGAAADGSEGVGGLHTSEDVGERRGNWTRPSKGGPC